MNWKFINSHNEKYKIYENGDIYDGDNKIEPFMHSKYKITCVKLLNENIRYVDLIVARLVYETFNNVKIRDDYKIVYKDNNTNNLNLNNLGIAKRYVKINNGIPIELDNTKIWIMVRGYEDLYKISEFGDVYSIVTNKIMSQNMKSKEYIKNYFRVTLTKNNEHESKLVHILVYTSFNNVDIDKNKVIDHIDRNKINNHKNNLREITRSENNKNVNRKIIIDSDKISQYDLNNNFIKEWINFEELTKYNPTYKRSVKLCCHGKRKSAYGFIWKYTDFVYDTTDFISIKTGDDKNYLNYKINKNGIVINQNGRKMKQITEEYYVVHLVSDCGYSKNFKVHRLVALTFIPNPNNKPVVNHLDENKYNNHVNNLEWATQSENIRYSSAKKIQQIDINTGKIINTFESVSDVYESLKSQKCGNIAKVCNGKQATAYGYKWKYVE